jgi:hypothetical protein
MKNAMIVTTILIVHYIQKKNKNCPDKYNKQIRHIIPEIQQSHLLDQYIEREEFASHAEQMSSQSFLIPTWPTNLERKKIVTGIGN